MNSSAKTITTYIGLALSCFKSACLSGDWNVFSIKENDWLIIPKPNNKMTIFGWTSATFANLSRRGDRFSRIPSLFDWTGRCSDHNAASWFALKQFFDVGKIFWNIQTAVKSAILLGMKFWHCTIGDEVVHIIIDVSGWRRRDPQGSGKYFENLPAQNRNKNFPWATKTVS